MIRSVTATNPKGEKLVLKLTNPDESGIIIKNIEGLGPAKSDIRTTSIASIDGSLYNSSKMQERNIVFTLQFLFEPDVETVRQKTYRFFQIKNKVTLTFDTDHRYVEITGYVESNTPDIFSKEESTQISIICPDPHFYAIGNSETVFSGVQPLFEFPFSNESLTENLIEFGHMLIDTRATLDYVGDVDTGVQINIRALGPAEDIELFNVDTQETLFINTQKIATITGQVFDQNDALIISTTQGDKKIRLLREGVYTNVIGALSRNSTWFQLSPGVNRFGFRAKTGGNNLMVSFSYKNAYGGI